MVVVSLRRLQRARDDPNNLLRPDMKGVSCHIDDEKIGHDLVQYAADRSPDRLHDDRFSRQILQGLIKIRILQMPNLIHSLHSSVCFSLFQYMRKRPNG